MTVKISGNSSSSTPSFAGDDGDSGLHATADQVQLVTNGTVAMTVDSSQNVGIGTETPTGFVHIEGSSTGTETYGRFTTGSAPGDQSLVLKSSASRDHMAIQVSTNSGTADDLALQPDGGNVGIGTTSPTRLLTVQSTGNANFCIKSSTTGTSQCMFGDTDSDVAGNIAYSHSNNSMAFEVNGSPRATIDSSGRLLVGTTSSSDACIAAFEGHSSNGTQQAIVFLRRGSTTPNNNDNIGEFKFSDSAGKQGAVIKAVCDGTWTSGSSHPGRLVFSTTADGASSPTERMRITSSGVVAFKSAVTNTGSIKSGSPACFWLSATSSTTNSPAEFYGNSTSTRYHVAFSNPNGVVGSISTNASATAYNTSSDYRLKENVVPLTGAANRLNQLQVRRFNFIADPDTTVDGFIAHEAQAVVPEAVTGTHDEVDDDGNPVYQGIDQSKLVPLLTAALQEAIAKIETLETVNAEQATTIASFEARISALEGGN